MTWGTGRRDRKICLPCSAPPTLCLCKEHLTPSGCSEFPPWKDSLALPHRDCSIPFPDLLTVSASPVLPALSTVHKSTQSVSKLPSSG